MRFAPLLAPFDRLGAARRRQRLAGARRLILACGLLAAGPALAQQGYDPRGAERQFNREQPEQRRVLPPATPRPQWAPGSASTKPEFRLKRVTIEGAEALPPDVLQGAYGGYLGRTVSQAELVAIAAALSDCYRKAGYHLSRAIVPPQDIVGGHVKFKMIEGRIAEVAFQGGDPDQFGIRPLFAPVLGEPVSRLPTLERALLLASDQTGVRVTDSKLEEIGTASGRFRLIITLRTWRVYQAFELDNLGSYSVGPLQAYSTTAFNSLVRPGDSLAVNFSMVPTHPRELAFGRLSYDTPIWNDGLRIGASALYSDVRPGDNRRQFDTSTRTQTFEVRGSFVPLKSQLQSLTFTLAGGWTDAISDDVFGRIYGDHVRTLTATLDYKLKDDFRGTNYVTLQMRQGIDAFGATTKDDVWSSRPDAAGDFTQFGFWLTRIQNFSDAWSLKLAGAGQLASGPLLLSQQFYLGGASFGRGYGSGEISGDNALAGTAELRFDHNLGYQYLKGLQLYAFLDTGIVWNAGFAPRDGLTLTSTGVGLRLYINDNLQAGAGVALPLTYQAPDNQSRSPRFLFSLSNAFRLCEGPPQRPCS